MTARKTLRRARGPGRGPRVPRLRSCYLVVFFLAPMAGARADDLPRTIFGSPGIIEMPSARMAPDGTLTAGGSYFSRNQHYNFDFQFLPWLDASFRYSGLQNFYPGFTTFYDRSFAVKLRLWDEGALLPATAIGINDLGGTGIFGGEYVVMSKRLGDFDATLGVGWGRLASTDAIKNPLTLVSRSFETRGQITGAGNTAFNTFFRGPKSGIFGGLTWHTPLDGLSLSLEYSSDRYTAEAASGNFRPASQINVGARYSVTDSVMLGVDWFHRSAVAFSLAFMMDPVHPQYNQKIAPPLTLRAIRTDDQRQAALEMLTGRRDTVLRPRPRLSAAQARAARNLFVDALMRSSADLEDVSIHGRVLILKVTDETPQRCRSFANIAQAADAEVDSVRLVGMGRSLGTNFTCQVEKQPALIEVALNSPLVMAPGENDTNAPSILDPGAARRKIVADARTQKITIETIALRGSEAIVYYNQFAYFAEIDAVGRLARILMADAPPSIETFRLINVAYGEPLREFDILRAPLERGMEQNATLTELLGSAVTTGPAPMSNPVLDASWGKTFPRFSWEIFPNIHESFFDPIRPLGLQLLMGVAATLEMGHGLSLQGEGEVSLVDNFFTGRASDSVLPHVRTDFIRYFVEGKNGIGDLEADWRFRLSPTVFGIAKAGVLESMFTGAGGEILWRPEGQRWALSFDGYEVWRRNYDRLFGLQPYHVFTGHVNLYYASPWYGLNFQLSAGQYLAGDRGLTFQMSRRFDTGVEVGAFVTKTNVSAADFGEGSFDKGFFITIPLGWVAPLETQRQITMPIRPVQRDGGQRLGGDNILFYETERVSQDELLRHLDTDVFQ